MIVLLCFVVDLTLKAATAALAAQVPSSIYARIGKENWQARADFFSSFRLH
jgi:hypothetical protein